MFDLDLMREAIFAFIERGGPVLIAIFVVTALMWSAILERLFYIGVVHWRRTREIRKLWRARHDHSSWHAHRIREMLISENSQELQFSMGFIKTLIAICPLLGLLGTVSGMIEVFDVMAVSGSGNARAMASGVSRATIPTMAGMVAALSGLLFSTQLQRFAIRARARLSFQLEVHEPAQEAA